MIENYDFTEFLKTLLINPLPGQLWFLRDLLILIILSPLIYHLITNFGFLIYFLMTAWLIDFNFYFFKNEAILFFSLGSFLALKGINLNSKIILKNKIDLILLALWFLCICLKIYLSYFHFDLNIIWITHKIGILIGILATWYFYDRIIKKLDSFRIVFIFIPLKFSGIINLLNYSIFDLL